MALNYIAISQSVGFTDCMEMLRLFPQENLGLNPTAEKLFEGMSLACLSSSSKVQLALSGIVNM